MTTATDFAKQLSRFLSEYLPHERNVSPNTLSAYRDAFVQYIDYMHTKKGVAVEKLFLKHLTRQNVIGYLNWILDERNCSPGHKELRAGSHPRVCVVPAIQYYRAIRGMAEDIVNKGHEN